MSKTKAITSFARYKGAALSPVAHTIYGEMNAHASTFNPPSGALAELLTLTNAFDAALAARASRSVQDNLNYRLARHALEAALGPLGSLVNSVAKGDPAIVIQSGFPSYVTPAPKHTGPPDAPTNVALIHGDLTGQVIARWHGGQGSHSHIVQVNPGDPNDAAGWTYAAFPSSEHAVLAGLTPGAVVWVRVQSVGSQNQMSGWSDPAQIRVL